MSGQGTVMRPQGACVSGKGSVMSGQGACVSGKGSVMSGQISGGYVAGQVNILNIVLKVVDSFTFDFVALEISEVKRQVIGTFFESDERVRELVTDDTDIGGVRLLVEAESGSHGVFIEKFIDSVDTTGDIVDFMEANIGDV